MFFAEAAAKKTKRRYELKEKLGEGGMGAVWRAFDTALEIDVAMKLLLDAHDPNALRLFYEESEKQAALAHPNIVEIRDKGSLEDGSVRTPYIVMPLLRGKTLAALIRSNPQPLPPQRCLDIITQASRGLQAAHDAGLLHRDIKPSNLFVLEDDSVKLLDFGVAHRLDLSRTTGRKGTLLYMSPEQLEMKALTRSSDVFSLGVVCYEMLTRSQPFLASSEDAVAEAIRSHHPPPPASINGEVSASVSQVVCKAMAKKPAHRFASMREFSEALRRAQYDELYTVFEPSRFEPRLAKAQSAFDEGRLQFAQELTDELLSEGYLVEGLLTLEGRVKAAVKQQTIETLMESARARRQDGEYRLALQRVSEVLDLDPHQRDALVLRHEIEASRAEADIVEWLRLGQQHLEKLSFQHAKQVAQRVLEQHPAEARVLELLAQIERREQEVQRLREQKQAAYAAAIEAEEHNEITAALSNMRIVLELEKQAPDSSKPAQLATYESFYNRLHAEHEAVAATYGEAKQALERCDYDSADRLCNSFLERMPQHALFKALSFDIDQRRRRAVSMRLLATEESVENEVDLDKRVKMLEEAVRQNPGVADFVRLLEANQQKRDLVAGIVSRARELEAREQYAEALAQWETLETIYPALPSLQFEIQNLRLRRQLNERLLQKSRWLAEINAAAERSELDESLRLLENALDSMPDDSELIELRSYLWQQRELAIREEQLLHKGRHAMDTGELDVGLECLRAAYDLGSKVRRAKTALVEGLLMAARASQEQPRQACAYLEEILTLDPGNHAATGFLRFLREQQEHAETDEALASARQLRTARDLAGAADVVKQALSRYPQSSRLQQLMHELDASRTERRGRDLDLLRRKRLEVDSISDREQLAAAATSAEQLAGRYQGDEEFQSESRLLKARLQTIAEAEPASPQIDVPPPKQKASARRHLVPLFVAGACLVVLACIGLRLAHRKVSAQSESAPPPPPAAGTTDVTIVSDPSGATIRDGAKILGVAGPTLQASLTAGEARLDADLSGYIAQTQQVQLVAGSHARVEFKLAPAAETLEVTGPGELQLDGGKPIPAHGAGASIGLSPGEHSLLWKGDGGSSLTLHAKVDTNEAASMSGWGSAERAMAVSTLNGSTDVYATKGSPLTVDGKYRGRLGIAPLHLNLSYGEHIFYVGPRGQGVGTRLENGSGRQLVVVIGGGIDPASLTVLSDVDGVDVKLMRGAKTIQQGTVAGGHLDISDIPPAKYNLVATLAGEQASFNAPVELKPQQQAKITLPFHKLLGTIRVHAPAGVQIMLDGAAAGQTGSDGTLLIAKVAQGTHWLEGHVGGTLLRQDVVIDNKNVNAASDVSLQPPAPVTGVLVLGPTPADAQIAIFGSNDQKIATSGTKLDLPPGKYRIEASEFGYASRTVTVDLSAGQTLPVDLTLMPVNASMAAPALTGWDADQWTLNKKAHTLTHTGMDIGVYAAKPAIGNYLFSGVLNHTLLLGWQKVQWVAGYRDPDNYLLFTLSHDALVFTSVAAGKKSPSERFSMQTEGAYQVMVHIGDDEASVSMRDGDHWKLVHTWKAVKQDLKSGSFGFKNDVTLTSFSYSR